MRFIISFLLSLILYLLVVFFIYKIFFDVKKEQKKEYIVHNAIIEEKPKPNVKKELPKQEKPKPVVKKEIKKEVKKEIKKEVKKVGSQSSLTHGGDNIDFNDIFKNVNSNIDTAKIHQKAQLDMSRFKGIEQELSKIKSISTNLNVNVSQSKSSHLSKKEIQNLVIKKLSTIWYDISEINGEYAKIHIVSMDGIVEAQILDSNLAEYKQKELLKRVEEMSFNKDFDLIVYFKTKAD